MCIHVQIMKFSCGRTAHRCQTMLDNNDTRWTIHIFIGSLVFVPNEPASAGFNSVNNPGIKRPPQWQPVLYHSRAITSE